MFFSKEIVKGMSNIYYEKTDVFKTGRKNKFLRKKIQRNALTLKSQKVQGIFGETFVLALLSSAILRLQNRVSDFFSFVSLGR